MKIKRLLAVAVLLSGVPNLAEAQVKLERKFEPGTTYGLTESVHFKQSFQLAGQDLSTEVTAVNRSKVKVSAGEAGAIVEESTMEAIKADLTLPQGQGTISFDSANPDAKSDNPLASLVVGPLKAQLGMTLKHTISADGKVGPVEGIKEGSQHNPDDLRKSYQQRLEILPKEPLAVGDTWERQSEVALGAGQILLLTEHYEYLGTVDKFPTVNNGKQFDKLSVKYSKVVFDVLPDRGFPATVTKSDLKVTEGGGALLFDRELGRFVDSKIAATIEGDLGLSVMGNPVEGHLKLLLEIGSKETP